MTIDVEIKCIRRSSRIEAHERISSVGGLNGDGSRWRLTLEAAIQGVEAGAYRFWTRGGGRSAWVVIAISAHGHKYLKTENDGILPDNLLSLEDCPA